MPMYIKRLSGSTQCILLVALLQACGGTKNHSPVDAYEQLERPPQMAITPSTEDANPADENLAHKGLGNKIQLLGEKSSPLLKLSVDFDNAWLLLEKALHHQKITITDHDREHGHFLVNFAPESSKEDEGLWAEFTGLFFDKKVNLRKYLLSVRWADQYTEVVVKDVGAVTTEADAEKQVGEVVDKTIKGAPNGKWQLLSALYKNLHDGFAEDTEKRQKHKKRLLD